MSIALDNFQDTSKHILSEEELQHKKEVHNHYLNTCYNTVQQYRLAISHLRKTINYATQYNIEAMNHNSLDYYIKLCYSEIEKYEMELVALAKERQQVVQSMIE